MNATDAIATAAQRSGWLDRTAYFQHDEQWTHAAVHSFAARLATVLRERGIGRGDRVLVALPDRIELIATFLAVGRIGGISVLVNPHLTESDHTVLAARVRPALTVCEAPLRARFDALRCAEPAELVRLADGAPESPAVPVPGDAPLYVQFTSGTTGEPKGAVHRHDDIAAYHHAVGEDMLGFRPEDVSLSISKMFFAYGFGNTVVYPLCSGSAAVLIPEKSTSRVVEELADRHAVTVVHGVPSAYANLVAETSPDAFRTVRAAVSAGESLAPGLYERAAKHLDAPVLNELGSTEVGGAFCSNTLADNEPGTVGRPLRGYGLRITDDRGTTEVPDGTEGRLWVRGPTLLAEYLDQPGETATVFDGEWLCTNDTALRRPDGRYVHTGRADDMELVGGINVSPHEVEAVLSEHPAVREAAVVALPDDRGASKLRAFVVPEPSTADPALLESDLLGLARARLAPFKVPRSVEFVAALPRTFTGKLQRFRVRQGAW